MEFDLRFHTRTLGVLRRWKATLGRMPDEQQQPYEWLMQALRDRLRKYHGRPPEATPDPDGARADYWWWFGDIALVRYWVDESPPAPRGWWDLMARVARLVRPHQLTITVIDWVPGPGRAAAVELPRS
jgi:hypothetical protein